MHESARHAAKSFVDVNVVHCFQQFPDTTDASQLSLSRPKARAILERKKNYPESVTEIEAQAAEVALTKDPAPVWVVRYADVMSSAEKFDGDTRGLATTAGKRLGSGKKFLDKNRTLFDFMRNFHDDVDVDEHIGVDDSRLKKTEYDARGVEALMSICWIGYGDGANKDEECQVAPEDWIKTVDKNSKGSAIDIEPIAGVDNALVASLSPGTPASITGNVVRQVKLKVNGQYQYVRMSKIEFYEQALDDVALAFVQEVTLSIARGLEQHGVGFMAARRGTANSMRGIAMRTQFLFLKAAVLISPLEDAYVKERLAALVKKKKTEGDMQEEADGELGDGEDSDEEDLEDEEREERFGGAIMDRDLSALETRGTFQYGTSYKSFSRSERARSRIDALYYHVRTAAEKRKGQRVSMWERYADMLTWATRRAAHLVPSNDKELASQQMFQRKIDE